MSLSSEADSPWLCFGSVVIGALSAGLCIASMSASAQVTLGRVYAQASHIPVPRPFPRIFFSTDSHTRQLVRAPIAINEAQRPQDDCYSTVPGTGGAVGNPIVVQSGNKIQDDTDFAGTGQMPLGLMRSYSAKSDDKRGLFGLGWTSNLEHTLSFYTGTLAAPQLACEARLAKPGECAVANPVVLVVRTEFGREYRYNRNAGTGVFENPADPSRTIRFSGGVYTLRHTDGSAFEFRADGLVSAIRDDVGLRWDYTYSAGQIRIQRSGGRAITIGVDPSAEVARTVTDPAGAIYRYDYDSPHAGARAERLVRVDYPGSVDDTRLYHYENTAWPNHLTGISLGGVRYATFDYYADGRGKSTEHAGGVERTTLVYDSDASGAYTDVTNALGLRSRYRYAVHAGTGVTLLDHVDRDAFNGCPAAAASYTYDSRGNVDVTIDWEGVQTDSDYDTSGQLLAQREGITTAHPRGLRYTRYGWTSGRLTSIDEYGVDGGSDRLFATTNYVYGTQTTATAKHAGDVANQLKTIVRTSHVGRLVSETTRYTYTVFAATPGDIRLETITEDGPAAGDTRVTTLSEHGDVLSVANDLGHTSRYTYDARGLPESHTDPNGDVVATTYDDRGRVATSTRTYGRRPCPPTGCVAGTPRVTQYEYDRFGQLAVLREPGQPELRLQYDDAGRLTSDTRRHRSDASTYRDHIVGYRYNRLSRPERITVSRVDVQGDQILQSGPVRMAFRGYDNAGRLTSVSEAHYAVGTSGPALRPIEPAKTTTYGYDDNGRLTTITDPLLRTTTFEYDGLGRRTAVIDGDGRTEVTHGYADTAQGRVPSVDVAPPGGATSHGYDGFGNPLFVDSPDSGYVEYAYTGDGRLRVVTTADGNTLTYYYDAIGRVQRIESSRPTGSATIAHRLAQMTRRPPYAITPVGSSSTLPDLAVQSFIYDTCSNGVGRLCEAVHGPTRWRTKYAYGDYGRQAERIETSAAEGFSLKIVHGYDTFGRPASITYPNNDAVEYTYTGGAVSNVDAIIGGARRTVADRIAYAPDGRLSRYDTGNGLYWAAALDLNGKPTQLTTDTVQSLSYGYDAIGMLETITNGIDAAGTQTYDYDSVGRLESSTRSAAAETWTYDAIGNREYHVRAAQSNDLIYRGNLLTDMVGTTHRQYMYNAFGGREQQFDNGESTLFAYDPWGQQGFLFRPFDVGTVCEPTAGPNDGCAYRGRILYDYGSNWRGQRTYKATRAIVAIDPKCRPGGYGTGCFPTETRRTGLTQYMFGDDGSLLTEHTTEGGRSTSNYIWFAGKPIAVIRDGALYQIASDHLGRPEVVTDSARNVVWRARNLAFHREVVQKSTSFGELNIGFPGQYYDVESNLYYNWHRYYDPSTGRYTQSDPIGLRGGLNSFAYAGNDPVGFADPYGLQANAIWIDPAHPSYAPGLTIPRIPGRYSVLAHGSALGPMNEKGNYMTVQETMKRILEDPNYVEGMPVDFYACNLAKGQFPAELADAIDASVYAAPGYVAVFPHFNNGYGGGIIVAPYRLSSRPLPWPAGLPFLPLQMIEFSPGGALR